MQTAILLFLGLLLAHLLADFPLQSRAMVLAKKTAWLPYLQHGGIHYVCAVACLLLLAAQPVFRPHIQLILLVYVLAHLAIDLLKQSLIRNHLFPDRAWLFLGDQCLHLGIILAVTWWLVPLPWAEVRRAFLWSAVARVHFLAIAVVYVGVLFGGGYFIRYCTRSLARQSVASAGSEPLQNAGLYIGWLERFLVITALLVQSPALVGLILTGKSIARFPELKDASFAEYFLIGTLLSISLALMAGLLLIRYLYGSVTLR